MLKAGSVPDRSASPGAKIANQGTYRSREVLIFDQATGAVLAQEEVLITPGGEYANERPGFVIYYLATRSSGWTNAKPTAPVGLAGLLGQRGLVEGRVGWDVSRVALVPCAE
jgi:hypothetical protein